MSESPFLFGEDAQQEVVVDETDGENGRRNVVVLGALGAVVLGAGAFFFLGGGDESEEDFSVPTRTRPAAAAAAPAAKAAVKLPPPSAVQLGRNPFKALYVAPAASAAGTGTTATGGTSTPVSTTPVSTTPVSTGGTAPIVVISGGGGTTQPTTSSPTKPAAQPTQSTAPAPKPAPAQSTVRLLSVASKDGKAFATFLIDGKEYSGKDLDILAGKLLIKSIGQTSIDPAKWYAVLQLGDGSPFEVHENQEVVVQ